jgi:hypothetical protein
MKIDRITDKFSTINSSEMDEWSTRKKEIKKGNKTLDLVLGEKVLQLFNSYNLSIEVGRGKVLTDWKLLLPDEKDLVEYRVEVVVKIDWDGFINDYEIDNDIEYETLSDIEKEKIEDIYNDLEYISHDEDISFSVFLPSNISGSIKYAAMSDASKYLKLLSDSNLNNVIDGRIDGRRIINDEIEGLKKFTILKDIKISNENIEDIITVGYRLYKDSKACFMFEEVLGSDTREFFRKWLKLVK